MDTYPIKDKNTKGFDIHKTILYATIIVLVILLFKSCHTQPAIPKPVVITGEKVKETINLTDRERQYISDSFNAIIYKQDKDIAHYKSNYDNLMADYLNLQNDMQNTFTKAEYPDTCKDIVNLLNGQFNKLKTTSAQKDKAASNTINSLTAQNRTKDKFLASKDTTIKKYRAAADTCAKALTAMEKYAKKLLPKRTIYISAIALGNENKYLNGYGIGLGLTNKKGTSFEVGAIQIGATINYSLSIKKPLIKF